MAIGAYRKTIPAVEQDGTVVEPQREAITLRWEGADDTREIGGVPHQVVRVPAQVLNFAPGIPERLEAEFGLTRGEKIHEGLWVEYLRPVSEAAFDGETVAFFPPHEAAEAPTPAAEEEAEGDTSGEAASEAAAPTAGRRSRR